MPQKRMVVLGNALALPVPEPLAPHIIRSKAVQLYLHNAPASSGASLVKIRSLLSKPSYQTTADYIGFSDSLEPYLNDQPTDHRIANIEKTMLEFAVYSRLIDQWPDIQVTESEQFLSLLLEVHRRLGTGANSWRATAVGIRPDASGNKILFPHHRLCGPLLSSLHTFLCNYSSQYPVVAATVAYGAIIHAHPFNDGNGRTARTLFNLLLSSSAGMRHFVPIHLIAAAHQGGFIIKLRRALYGDDWGPLQDFFSDAIRLSRDFHDAPLSETK